MWDAVDNNNKLASKHIDGHLWQPQECKGLQRAKVNQQPKPVMRIKKRDLGHINIGKTAHHDQLAGPLYMSPQLQEICAIMSLVEKAES